MEIKTSKSEIDETEIINLVLKENEVLEVVNGKTNVPSLIISVEEYDLSIREWE